MDKILNYPYLGEQSELETKLVGRPFGFAADGVPYRAVGVWNEPMNQNDEDNARVVTHIQVERWPAPPQGKTRSDRALQQEFAQAVYLVSAFLEGVRIYTEV